MRMRIRLAAARGKQQHNSIESGKMPLTAAGRRTRKELGAPMTYGDALDGDRITPADGDKDH
jgi:hypothetical protein